MTPAPKPRQPSAGAALVGTVVHRLFQAAGRRAEPDDEWLDQRARAFISASDDVPGVEADAVVAEAVAGFKALRRQPELAALIESAACEFEVPFSVRLSDDAEAGQPEPVVVRGSIDCLATLPDGRVRVVELKTGRPQSWHEAQIDTYVRAARALFPGVPVEGQLVYAHRRRDACATFRCNRNRGASV